MKRKDASKATLHGRRDAEPIGPWLGIRLTGKDGRPAGSCVATLPMLARSAGLTLAETRAALRGLEEKGYVNFASA